MGLVDRFKEALTKTRERLSVGVRTILSVGRALDDATIDRLEEILYGADLGATGTRVIEEVRKSYKLRYLTTVNQIPGFLRKNCWLASRGAAARSRRRRQGRRSSWCAA